MKFTKRFTLMLVSMAGLFGCKNDAEELTSLQVEVLYKQYLSSGRDFITPYDQGATVYLFQDVNLTTSAYRFDGKESVTDGSTVIPYFRKGLTNSYGKVVFDALPMGTHGIAVLSKEKPGKWVTTSVNTNMPGNEVSITIE